MMGMMPERIDEHTTGAADITFARSSNNEPQESTVNTTTHLEESKMTDEDSALATSVVPSSEEKIPSTLKAKPEDKQDALAENSLEDAKTAVAPG